MSGKKNMSLDRRHSLTGWLFLLPATVLLCWVSFYPMFKALILSFKTGIGQNMKWAGTANYERIFEDKVFQGTLFNNFLYLIIQVPIMLILALLLASLLNSRNLKFKGLFRTAIFLPCATSLVAYSIVFRSMFSLDGFVNSVLLNAGIITTKINWLTNTGSARAVIIIALIWRWTGYNMLFYLAGLQNIEGSIYEAARIDGAGPLKLLTKITVPILQPIILLTSIMSTIGTLQLFDESFNLTNGGPANSTMTMSHYIYKVSFLNTPKFGYAAAMSFVILIIVAVLSFVQMKKGDKR